MRKARGNFHSCFLTVMEKDALEFITILYRQISACPVNSPTRIAIKIIEDILERDEYLRFLAEVKSAAQIENCIRRQRCEKRNCRVVINNPHAVDSCADGQQTVLNLRERFARRNQSAARRAANPGRARRS